MAKSIPIIKQWYQDVAVNRPFEVIAVDEYSALIKIRYAESIEDDEYYGNSFDENSGLDEISFDDWAQMVVVTAEAPEDWRSSFALSDDIQMFVDDIIMPDSRDGSNIENLLLDNATADNIDAANYLFGWDEF